jgi:hypothetical protein
MKTQANNASGLIKPLLKVKKQKLSLLERIQKNIPDGKYETLITILEPHEIPDRR